MKITDQQLSAYLDGELPVTEMRAIEAALASNPGLRERLEALANASNTVKAALGPIAEEPVPDHILAMLDGDEKDSNVVDMAAYKERSKLSRWATPIAASLALAVGVTAGTTMVADNASQDVLFAQMSGTVSPENPLFEVLEASASAESVSFGDAVSVKPVLTFKTADGYCREFAAQSQVSALRGVACRGDSNWEIVLLNRAEITQATGYQTASGASDIYVDQLVDELIEGIPLSAEEEKSTMDADWQPPNQ